MRAFSHGRGDFSWPVTNRSIHARLQLAADPGQRRHALRDRVVLLRQRRRGVLLLGPSRPRRRLAIERVAVDAAIAVQVTLHEVERRRGGTAPLRRPAGTRAALACCVLLK
jgi:hypothetical protein